MRLVPPFSLHLRIRPCALCLLRGITLATDQGGACRMELSRYTVPQHPPFTLSQRGDSNFSGHKKSRHRGRVGDGAQRDVWSADQVGIVQTVCSDSMLRTEAAHTGRKGPRASRFHPRPLPRGSDSFIQLLTLVSFPPSMPPSS